MATRINVNGIHELQFALPGTTSAAMASPGAVLLTNAGFNGVNPQTANYTVQSSDNQKLISFNSTSALTATLPQPGTNGIDNHFAAWIANLGTGALTISPSSATIDGAATLSLSQNQGVAVFTDGTNYFTVRGMGGSSSYSGAANEVLATPNGSSGTATLRPLVSADLPLATTSAAGAVKPDGSTITISGGVISASGGAAALPQLYAPPSSASFPNLVGGLSPALSTGALTNGLILTTSLGASGDSWNYCWQAAPAAPYTLTARLRGFVPTTNFTSQGLVLSDSTGKIITLALGSRGNDNIGSYTAPVHVCIQSDYWNSPTSYNSSPFGGMAFSWCEYFRVKDDGTNLTFYISNDGDVWYEVATASRTAFLTSGPTRIGFGVNQYSGTAPALPNTLWTPSVNCVYWKAA